VKNNSLKHCRSWYLVRRERCRILVLRLNRGTCCSFC